MSDVDRSILNTEVLKSVGLMWSLFLIGHLCLSGKCQGLYLGTDISNPEKDRCHNIDIVLGSMR